MKKKVSFEKKIEFPTMIGEICAISLEPNLSFANESLVEGNLLLFGRYKLTEATRLEEDFQYKIPIEINLMEKLDLNTSRIDIHDFTYEIENTDTLICHIELQIEGLEKIEEELVDEVRECDGDPEIMKEIEIPVSEEKKEVVEEVVDEVIEEEISQEIEEDNSQEIVEGKSLFANLTDDNDSYGTFIVYIVRQNESINEILEKYHTTLEELEKYNDIKDFHLGSKLIIPLVNE